MEPVLVITVHGIRTFGHWQDRFGKLVRDAYDNAVIEGFRYGYFSLISFIIPPLRWMFVIKFANELNFAAQRHPGHRIVLVGHSFGTHIIAWSLYRLVTKKRCPKVSTVILAGSVLRSSFPWNSLLMSGHVGRVINDCGINDTVLILSQFFVFLTGMAGRIGFIGMTGAHFVNRFFKGGHSLYFENFDSPDDEFMRKYWLPLIDSSILIENVDQRDTTTPMQGIWLTAIQNADLLKLIIYGIIIFTFGYFGYLKPNRVAKENAERANIEFSQRQSQVAATMLSAGIDISAAVATLADLANFHSTIALSIKGLSYWLPTFVPLPDILKGQDVALVSWEDQNILIIGEKQFIVDGPRATAFALTHDKKRIIVQDDSNNIRVINVDDFSELATANLKSGKVSFSQRLKSLARVSPSDTPQQAGFMNSGVTPEINEAEAPYADGVSPIELNDIFESKDKSLILLFGVESENNMGGTRKPLIIAINLIDRSLSGLDLDETKIEWANNDCSQLIVRRHDHLEENNEAFYYTDFSTRKNGLFLKKLKKDEASQIAQVFDLKLQPTDQFPFAACPGAALSAHRSLSSPPIGKQGGTFDASLAFPMILEEKGFWRSEAINQRQLSQRWVVTNYKGSLFPTIPANSSEIEAAQKKLDPSNDGDVPPRSVGLMQTLVGQFLTYSGYYDRYSTYFIVCQLTGECLRSVLKESGTVSVSEDGRYMAVAGEVESSIKIIDLANFKAYTPPTVPTGQSALALATTPARLFVRERDAVTVYNIDHGLSFVRKMRVHAGAGALADFGVVGHIVLAKLGENGLVAFDETGQRLWASAGVGLAVPKFSGSVKNDVAIVFSSDKVRLLNLSTGFPLTRVFSIRDLPVLKDHKEESPEVILNAWLRNDGRVELVTSERIVVRDAPMSAEAVHSARALGLERWLGNEASGRGVSPTNRLPLINYAAQSVHRRFADNPK